MEFRFYINGTEIDEPVGFDATKIKLKRSENWHGVMAEASEETIEVYGAGFTILSGLYAVSGIDAIAVLGIEYYCAEVLQDTIEYNITFYEYEEFCGDDCYCKVGIEKSGCYYKFVNAMDTKVDLDALKAIDTTTDLADYEYLGKEIEVPSKTIILTSNAETDEEETIDFFTTIDNTFPIIPENYNLYIYPPLAELNNEINTFSTEVLIGWFANTLASGSDGDEQYMLINNFSYECADNTEFRVTGRFIFDFYADCVILSLPAPSIRVVIEKTDLASNRTVLYNTANLITVVGGGVYTSVSDVTIDETIALAVGEKVSVFVRFFFATNASSSFTDLRLTYKTGTFVRFDNNSTCTATNAKLYLVNETLSHISEYVTNNCLRVYSEYLGRTDSSPYNFADDGCGGMLGLTSGLFLRRIEDVKTGDEAPKLSLSFNDVINAINTIYPLGLSIETSGEDEVIRIEDWQYFYNEDIITDIGIVSVKKMPNLKVHFKNYKTGYSKYEAEEYNGLDEFLTEREYTTSLVNHNGMLDKVCQFIASGYAIEITRRKGNADSKDWRFDNDTFIICLDRNYSELAVEQGNIVNDANIIDASTILNYRISPARMAMQWFKYITTFLKTTKELLFSSGKGNTAAEGELVSVCSIETGVISEKQNLTQINFIEDQNGIYLPELHSIEGVPFTFQQYKLVKDNPHGLIAYRCSDTQLYGWINEISYSFVDGTVDLVLIPKN